MLWCIDFAQASRHRKRLVKIIPDLLNVLRDGLLSIDYPLAQSKVFFDELMRLHEQSLIGVAAPAKPKGNKLDDLEKRLPTAMQAAQRSLGSTPQRRSNPALWTMLTTHPNCVSKQPYRKVRTTNIVTCKSMTSQPKG